MYPQHLPDFKTDFHNAPWIIKESEHYLFHYLKGSLAEKEISQIQSTQEDAFLRILSFLKIEPPRKKISYYLYPSDTIKKELMGTPWFAQSVYNDFSIHALYTDEDRVIGPHEDTHLLSLPLGLSIGFLQEGLAESLTGHDWYGNQFIDVVREARKDKKFIFTMSLLINHKAWLDTDDSLARQYYSLAGLFSSFLIDTYGKDNYLKLYSDLRRDASDGENSLCYKTVFGEDVKVIFDGFVKTIPS